MTCSTPFLTLGCCRPEIADHRLFGKKCPLFGGIRTCCPEVQQLYLLANALVVAILFSSPADMGRRQKLV